MTGNEFAGDDSQGCRTTVDRKVACSLQAPLIGCGQRNGGRNRQVTARFDSKARERNAGLRRA